MDLRCSVHYTYRVCYLICCDVGDTFRSSLGFPTTDSNREMQGNLKTKPFQREIQCS
jgi:hypothetical protein